MRADAARWCRKIAGQRLHGTTGERPVAAFQQREQRALRPLPPQPWERVVWTSALVGADCHLRVGGAAYSVPYKHVNQLVPWPTGRRRRHVRSLAPPQARQHRRPILPKPHPLHRAPPRRATLPHLPPYLQLSGK